MKLSELAQRIGGKIHGNPDTEITGVAGIKEASKGDISYLTNRKNRQELYSSEASAVITNEEIKGLHDQEAGRHRNFLIVNNPQFTFAKAIEVFYVPPYKASGISEKARIGSNAELGSDISIHHFAVIGSNVALGDRVTVSAGVFIGDNVSIGEDSIIHPNVTIRENVTIGKSASIHPGTVIGSDGFGYVFEKGEHYKIPHAGGVIIGDNVEIGANVTIDRATLGNTFIGSGTKIDNLVQIAHNVRIGRNCIIVAQVGISGSVEIGDGVVIAGQVAIRDHLKIHDRATIGGQSGVVTDIPEGEVFSGSPAIPHKKWLRAQNIYSKLPEYIKRLKELEDKLNNSD